MSTADALYLAIDQGGHASRAMAFDSYGDIVAHATQEIATQYQGNRVEHDAETLLASVRSVIDNVSQQLGADLVRVVSAGLATQRSSIVCWDKYSGIALSPVISWQDRRANDWLATFAAHREHIQYITGLVMSPHYGASKLHWCLDHLPSVQTALAQERLVLGPLASFLAFRLCNERPLLVDPANAGRTLLWNIHSHDWDASLLDLFGVPHSTLPQCVPTRHAFGCIPIGNHSAPLQIVTGDQSAALFAQGDCLPDVAYVNVGTGAFVLRISDQQLDSRGKLLSSIAYADSVRTRYALEGTINGAGSALSWLETIEGPLDIVQQGEAWLAQSTSDLIFLNGVSGLGAPFWVADFPSQFLGTGASWEKAVAIIDSVIFLLKVNLDEMALQLKPPSQIVISGGFSILDGFCQRLADISGIPVYRPRLTEATSKGVACLLAHLPHWPLNSQSFQTQPNLPFSNAYQRWHDAMLERLPY